MLVAVFHPTFAEEIVVYFIYVGLKLKKRRHFGGQIYSNQHVSVFVLIALQQTSAPPRTALDLVKESL